MRNYLIPAVSLVLDDDQINWIASDQIKFEPIRSVFNVTTNINRECDFTLNISRSLTFSASIARLING